MMKKIKMALLAIAATFTVCSANASTGYTGHLIVGFTLKTGNDLVYDIGTQASLTDNKSWDLSGIGLLAGKNLDVIYWGVVGTKNVSGTYTSWMTKNTVPNNIPNDSTWGNIDTAVSTIYQYMPSATAGSSYTIASTDATSWYQETINSGAPLAYISNAGDPNAYGKTTIDFYSTTSDNSAPTKIGKFTLSGAGILTYNTNAASIPPTITLNTPANGSSYAGFANIPLSANVVSNGNAIVSVKFYNGATLLATATTPPYTGTWSYVAPGSYPQVTAQAIYGSGTVTSAVASVTVNALVTPAVSAPVKNGSGFSFSFTGPMGQPYTVLTSTNVASPLSSWTVAQTNVSFGVSGTAGYTNSTPTDPQRFYRVKSP